MKNIKGITLISLIITVIVLLILASVAVYSGIDIIESSKFTKFVTELKIMQTQINALYGENTNFSEIGKELEGKYLEQAKKVFTQEESEINDYNGYRYWSIDEIKSLGIEGVEQDFFINGNKRSIVSYNGIDYQGKKYYTLNQVPNSLYNVEYYNASSSNNKPTFEVNYEHIKDSAWRIIIPKETIEYNGYVNKWKVKYKLTTNTSSYESTSNDLNFIVDKSGTYEIYIENGKIKSDKQQLRIFNDTLYFDVAATSPTITFGRTTNEDDHEDVLTTNKEFNLEIKNNDGTNYTELPITYEIRIVDSPKFTFEEGDVLTKEIQGEELKNETITLNLKIKDLTKTDDTFKLKIIARNSYATKTIEMDFNVVQEGAIQTIEDLLDLSIAVRDSNKSNSVSSQRYKMTRDLDFNDVNSYENAHRTDYGNINLDNFTGKDLMEELTDKNDHAGFLPIGTHENGQEFKGTFNGGGYTISNLHIWKSLQEDIGLFGHTIGADIRNFKIVNGNVHNANQTAGMIIGKAEGGKIENITIESGNVEALDQINTERDTYTGGIVGYLELGGTVNNCTNKANVTTKFSGDPTKNSGAAGGITAWMSTSTITNCKNEGTIIGDKYLGGIAGFSGMQDSSNDSGSGTISGCENSGTIYSNTTYANGGNRHIGGIAGYNKANGLIERCNNLSEAVLRGGRNVGGIIGTNNGTVDSCINYSSNISGEGNVKGTCGSSSSSSKEINCQDFS